MSRVTIHLILLLVVGLAGRLSGQDIHFSQFHMSPLNVNPSLAGVINGDQRFSAIVRDQWRSVPVPYLTVGASFDMRFNNYRFPEGFFGAGVQFNYDKAGDSQLSLVNLALSGSYSYIINRRNIITGGLGLAVNQRRFNEDDLRWERQWNGDSFDPDINSGELFDNTNLLFFDINAGINYRYQVSRRTWINVGGAAFHLTQPDQSYYSLNQSTDTNLPMRFTGLIQSSFQIADGFDLMVNAVYQNQNPYQEIVANGIGRIYISNKPGRHYILDLGLGYRVDDAFYPLVGFQYNNWYVSATYDINTSFFEVATNGRGGPEVALRYIFARPAPPLEFKKCPVY